MEKHNLYYDILESFQNPGCPACFHINKSTEKYFDDILYEGAADYGFIENFRKNKGFCNFHAYKLAAYKNGLAVVSLYRYLLLDRLEEYSSPNFHIKHHFKNKCQACDFTSNAENNYISTFCEFINETELSEPLVKSDGFCLPHFTKLSDILHGKLPNWLSEFQISRFQVLKHQLERYLDFQNYSLGDNRPDLSHEEQRVYQKVVRLVNGYEGMK